MFLLRLSLLLSLLSYLAAYPVESQEQQAALDPADYPDLTNGLSDAEVESTLNGLSLEDLNALNKLLDDANNGPVDLKASLRGRHRQAKKQHYEDMENGDEEAEGALKSDKQSADDSCHDLEDDLDKEKDLCSTTRPKCNKQPTCSSTRRCTSTRRCYTTPCRSLDGLLNINLDSKLKRRKLSSKQLEDCDADDEMCLQRNRERAKQRPNLRDFSEISLDQAQDQGNIDSLEKLAAEAHRDQSMKLRKDLDQWQPKDEPSSDMFNMDGYKVPNVDAMDTYKEHNADTIDTYKVPNADANFNVNDFKESLKLAGEDEGQQAQLEEEAKRGMAQFDEEVKPGMAQFEEEPNQGDAQFEEETKQAEAELPYERHQLARMAHQEEEKHEVEDNGQVNSASALLQAGANDELGTEGEDGEPLAANDGDSFIANNARDPQRYVIQTNNGIIKSENELGEHRLRADKEHSEMLNYANYQLSKEENSQMQQQQQLDNKRFKRENMNTDDAPENTNESYLKKLMDSFPRDQLAQSNVNMAIREAKRAHMRVKRC